MITVSVIIPNLNRKELLVQCLESLDAQTRRDFETIVVDNGSDDGSREFLKSREGERLRVILFDENQGFARACNAGIAKARGRYVAILNNDAQADPLWLESLAQAMESLPAAGMAASKILMLPEKTRIDKVGHLLYWDGLNHGRGCGELDQGQYDRQEECLFPDGAAAMYRKDMLDRVGGFNEEFFAYGDDCDLGLRARRAGWSCVYAPKARAYHVHSATAGEYSTFKAFLIERNRIWVAIRHFPILLLAVSPVFTLVRLLLHAYGAIFGIGPSGKFAVSCTRLGLIRAMGDAYISAAKGCPRMWRSRKELARTCRMSSFKFISLVWKYRCPLRRLTLGI